MEVLQNCCIGLLILAAVGTHAQTDQCTEADMDACYDNFTPIQTSIEESVIIRPFNDNDIELHCREYEDAKACIQDFDEHCHVVDRLLFYGRDAAYDWLCEDALDEYKDHRTCWGKQALHDEGDRCNDTLTSDFDSISTDRGSEYYFRKVCLYANHYLDCIDNSVTSECDADAAAWHREYDTRLLHPLLSATGCRLRSDGTVYYPEPHSAEEEDDGISTITYIIVGCIVAITLILAVVLILLMLHIRQKRHKQRSRDRQSNGGPHVYFNNGADPSVSAMYGAHAGPLPTKGPEPPAYDPLPPPSYSTSPEAHAKAHSVAGSSRSHPPEYASQVGSVRAPSERSFPDDPVYRGAASSHSYVDIDPSDVRSVKSHKSHASSRSHPRY